MYPQAKFTASKWVKTVTVRSGVKGAQVFLKIY